MSTSLVALTSALDRGATGLTPTAARTAVAHWAGETRTAGLETVADSLDALYALLGAERLDGRAIAASLRSLGESTAALAVDSDETGASLSRLGAVLVRIATALGG